MQVYPSNQNDYSDNNHQSLLEKILFPVRSKSNATIAAAVENKTILITGATFGIGRLLAERLSIFTVTLLLVGRTADKLEELKQKLSSSTCIVHTYIIDLREEEQINLLLRNFKKQQLFIDIFINNAGKSINRILLHSIDRFKDTKRCSAVNYIGPVQLLLGLLPALIEKKGHIINVSALNVMLPPTVGWSAYQSSKVAFDQWLKCNEPELKAAGICTSTAYLPLVRTRMSMVNEKNKERPAMSKEKAVSVLLNLMVSKKRKYIPWWSGAVFFASALLPNLWYRLQLATLNRKIKK